MATTSKKTAVSKTSSSSETKFIKELANILSDANLAELEYETDTVAIRLSRVSSASPVVTAQPPTTSAVVPSAIETVSEVEINPADNPGAVTSPMVGTVYTSPEPDAPAFIVEGDSVNAGQTLLIVEAMKVMNPITAPKAGKVVKVFVRNAQPIEFGEVLVIVE
ncbi:acetyl-CoA carboxylase biotin carboxyl carrier protein [Candidatus Puniceispirillum sp.]|nr:acetyl-CoA carboxylase biotin carboxyl carrier protein [Candidatus Puniceispirillum sp.]